MKFQLPLKYIIILCCFGFNSNGFGQNYCAFAEALSIQADGSCTSQAISPGADLDNQDDNAGQTDITINTACANPAGSWNAYWGSFTGNGNAVDIVISNPNNDGLVVVFENTPCGGTMNELACFNFLDGVGDGMTINTTNGANYTVCVMRATGSASLNANISIVDNPPAEPYNLLCDACSIYGPIPSLAVQSVNTDCFSNFNSVVTDDNVAMPSIPGCTSGPNWYLAEFTATESVTNAYLWGKEEDNVSISILEGSCSSLTEVACENSTNEDLPTFIQANTIPGQQYYVLITSSSSMSAANLCIYTDPPAVPDLPVCDGGMSFEDGVGAGWDASHGAYHPQDISLANYVWDGINAGIPQPIKGEITSGNGFDPNVGGMLPVVAPGGGNFSFRLGSLGTAEGFGPVNVPGYTTNQNQNHAANEIMSFCFTVDANNAGFGYKYAVVMDYSAHAPDLQPKIEVFIEEDCIGGALIACGQYEHYPNDGNSDFHFVGDATDVAGQNDGLIFTNWTDVATDLTNYIGQDVRVTFRIRDCEGGGSATEPTSGSHWAYAYIDTYCTPLDIITPEFCAGQSQITICAPDGFASYDWPAGQPGVVGPLNGQCITINNPIAGDTYIVNMISISGCPVTKEITLQEVPAVLSADTTTICDGDMANLSVTPTGNDSPYTFNWSTGDTGSSINVSPAATTTYTVDVSNNSGCTSTYDLVVVVDPCNTITLTLPDTTICENDCATIEATTTGTTGTVTYNWTPNIGNGPGPYNVCPLVSTDYVLTITDQSGATATETSTVTVNPVHNLAENITTCENSTITYPDGSTETITANTSHTSNLTTVAGCDSVIVTNVIMAPVYNLTENITACENSAVTFPDGTTATISGNTTYTSNLTTTNGCDSIIVTNVTMNPIYALSENVDVCTGSDYTYPDGTTTTNITVNESHVSNLTSMNGCDSIVTTNINVINAFNVSENFDACSGSNFTYPDGTVSSNITVNESHVSNFVTSMGCDSVVTTSINVLPVYNLNENVTICENASITYPDGTTETITANTSHTSNLTTLAGCDSVIVTNVIMAPVYNLTENITACENSSVTYPDGTTATISVNTSYTSNLTTTNGCDSIIVTNVTMNPIYALSENVDVCTGSDYTYPDGTTSTNITVNESHVSNLTSMNGCDSIVTTNVNVINAFNVSENFDVCSGSNFTYPDGTVSSNITVNESHVSNFVTSMGCDSVVTTSINVLPVYNLNENVTICENASITYPDGTTETITANTSHTSNLTTLAGCDSVIVTNVIMAPIYNLTENITACENSSVTYPDGTTATISGNTSYTSNLTTTNGCDSIIVTNVTMNPVYALSENVDVCTGSDYTYPDGTTSTNITVNESHVSVFSSVQGCDSTVTTNINVTPTNFVNAGADITLCEGETVTLSASGSGNYSWNNGVTDGVSFTPTLSGTYSVNGVDSNGCPSTDSLEIIVNPLPVIAFVGDQLSGCAPLVVTFDNLSSPTGNNCLWEFGDGATAVGCGSVSHTYSNPGIYSVSLTVTANGCTSTETYVDYIQVFNEPLAAFDMDHDIINEDDNLVEFTNNSINADFYTWNFGDGTINSVDEHPIHGFGPTQNNGYTITLFAENAAGCVDSTQLFIPFEDVLIFYVPNVFTPDGDDVNNTFFPVFTSGYDPYDYHLMIFNRWGELIFESYNAAFGWNGHYGNNGLVQDGVYVWSIDFRESKTDKRHEVKGHVSVLK